MNQAAFEILMKFWKRAQDEELGTLSSLRTTSCLSFEDLRNYAKGKIDTLQQSHVMRCSHCHAMVQLFEKHLTAAPTAEATRPDATENSLVFWGERLSTSLRQLPRRILDEGRWRMPLLRPVLVGVLLAIVIYLVLSSIPPRERNYADLAMIEPMPYRSLQVRGGAAASEAERLFEEGMAAYVRKDYAGAVQKLVWAVHQDSANASFHFYLGLCYSLSGSIDSAIAHLQKAIALGGNSVLEKAYWYLGNAWLLKGERDRALEAFRKVVKMEGDYQWEAEEMIGKIEKLSRK